MKNIEQRYYGGYSGLMTHSSLTQSLLPKTLSIQGWLLSNYCI